MAKNIWLLLGAVGGVAYLFAKLAKQAKASPLTPAPTLTPRLVPALTSLPPVLDAVTLPQYVAKLEAANPPTSTLQPQVSTASVINIAPVQYLLTLLSSATTVLDIGNFRELALQYLSMGKINKDEYNQLMVAQNTVLLKIYGL